MVRDAVERGELVEVLPEWDRDPLPLYVVYPQTRHLSNKVRVFVDWLAKQIQMITRDPPVELPKTNKTKNRRWREALQQVASNRIHAPCCKFCFRMSFS